MKHASICSLALAGAFLTATFTLGCSDTGGAGQKTAGPAPATPKTAPAATPATTPAAVPAAAPAAVPAAMTLSSQVVEASCGECQFGMPGNGCNLAVRLGEQAWFVDGTAINDHGDSHAADGFCNAIRKARVSGSVQGGRLAVTSFELVE